MGCNYTTVLEEKSFHFAARIVKLSQYLLREHKEFVLSRQILRSGTAIGALIRESKYAESKQDFLHKQMVALKEANESDYWIELLYTSNLITRKMYSSLKKDMIELLKMLVASTKTVKEHMV